MEEKQLEDFLPDKKTSYYKRFNSSNITTKINQEQVIERIKNTQGEFVLYAMTASSFEALALNFEQIKRFIEEQNQVILYYEKAVTPKESKGENND